MHPDRLSFVMAFAVVLTVAMGLAMPGPSYANLDPPPMSDSPVTTEFSCSFGMDKSDAAQNCQVPILSGCVVAHFPGTAKPWTNISKGGNTQCRFDGKKTDWKTRIIGACERCKSAHCSVQFIVKFDCSQR
jgi:hypothetical protein